MGAKLPFPDLHIPHQIPVDHENTWQLRNGLRVPIDELPPGVFDHACVLVCRAYLERQTLHPALEVVTARMEAA